MSKQFFDFSLNFVFENFTSSKWPTKNFLKSSTMTTIAHQYQLEGAPKKWGKRGAMGQVFNFQYFPIPPLFPHFLGAPSNWYWRKNTKPFLNMKFIVTMISTFSRTWDFRIIYNFQKSWGFSELIQFHAFN